MSKDLYIQDTAKVFFKSLVTGNIVGVGYAQVASIEGSAEETEVRGGIGNPLAYVIKSAKSIDLNVTSATFKPEFLALMQGTEYKNNATTQIMDSTYARVQEIGGTLQLTLPDELKSLTTVRLEDLDSVQQDVPSLAGVVDIPEGFEAKAGDELEVFYLKTITGRALEFDASKHPSKYRVEMSTLCYDRETQAVYSDIHFVFPEATPSSTFSMNLQNGEAYIPEMNFKVTSEKGTGVLGTKYEVLR